MSSATSPNGRDPVTLRAELRDLFQLAAPILLTHMGQMLLGLVDTAVVGRLGEVELGAAGLGNTIYFTVGVLGFGWMLALDPLIAQAVGANEPRRARALLAQGGWVGLGGAVPLVLAVLLLAANLSAFGVPDETTAHAWPYLMARVLGLLPFLWLAAARSYLQAHEMMRPLIIGVAVANLLNLPLTYLLVFGDGGLTSLGLPPLSIPALGTAGAGFASSFATVVQLLIAVAAVRAIETKAPATLRPSREVVLKVLRLGTPIGLQLMAEVGSFAIVTLLMANLGTRPLSGHQVALTMISMTFQVPLAIGAATSVRVGHAVGRADQRGTLRAGLTGIGVGALTMVLFAALFVSVPGSIARVITDERAVIEAAIPLFFVAAAFQISDGVQAISAAALRGAGDTRWPLVANLVGHYGVGLPLGALLTFGLGFGAVGLWWGLSAGLTAVAIGLVTRFYVLARQPIARA